jgi:hypothetical protein
MVWARFFSLCGADRWLWNNVEALYISNKSIGDYWLIEFRNNAHDETKLRNNMP